MKIHVDSNHLLVIDNENIPKTKEYRYQAWGYSFSDYDKGLIVLIKKDFRIINLKNLSDGMSVVYVKNNTKEIKKLDETAFQKAFGLFKSFDEISGETYFFIPNMKEKEMQTKNEMLEKLKIKYRLKKTDKWIITDAIPLDEPMTQPEEIISFLFGLTLLHGKLDSQKDELISMKIQIPLFGNYLNHQEKLDSAIQQLQQIGIFMKVDKLMNTNWLTYQISSNDYELLGIFAQRHKAVENFQKVTKRDFTDTMKEKLISFLESDTEIPSEGKDEVIKKIKEWSIKLLSK